MPSLREWIFWRILMYMCFYSDTRVLAPEDVSVHSNLEIPEFDPETTVLLFPSEVWGS